MAWIGAAISTAGGLLGGLLGGGDDEAVSTTTGSNEPWAALQPHLKDLYGKTDKWMNKWRRYYPYQTYADRAPLTEAGMEGLVGYATDSLPQLFASGNEGLQFMLNSPDVANNPYVQNAIAAQNQQIGDTLQRQWLPSIRSGATQAGQYGGTRQGIAEGLAMGEAAKAAQNAAAQIQLGAYGQGLDQQAKAMTLLPQQAQMGMLPFNIMGDVGAMDEAYRQRIIQDAMDRYNYNRDERYNTLNWAAGILHGAPSMGTSTSTTTQQLPGSSPWANAIGTGMSIYGLGQNAGWWGGTQSPAPVSGPTGPIIMGSNPIW